MSGATETIDAAALERLMAAALAAAGTSSTNAESVAAALAAAEIDGQKGHGLSRVPQYAAQVRNGKMKGQAVATLTRVKPAILRIDAANGFAFPALDLAVAELPALTRTHGIAAAAIVHSSHAGALGSTVERLAQAGCLALMYASTPAGMAAWGGNRPIYGTNPVAFAAPRRGAAPLIVDLALTEVARAKLIAAAEKGEAIPPTWAVDASGQPTTDPKAALAGTLLPAGGAKGAALALMVEVLAAAFTGSQFGIEATSFLDDKGGPPDVGQLIIVIDAGGIAGTEAFGARLEVLLGAITASGARLPGSRRLAARERVAREGVTVDARLLAQVRALAGG